MGTLFGRGRGRSSYCTLMLAAALVAGFFVPAVFAQTTASASKPPTEKSLAFEVVSIRPDLSPTIGESRIVMTPDGWHMTHSALIGALLNAYVPTKDAMMYTMSTLVGVPDWVHSEKYSIDAKVSESDLAAWQNPANQPAMLRAMLQTMLAERCKLAVHRGSKTVAVYWLVVGKNGPRLKASASEKSHPGAIRIPGGGGAFLDNDGTGKASFYASPVKALAVVLSNFAGRPVVDKTGLTGRYDMSFRRPIPGGPSMEPDSTLNPPPSIFEVAESFGLKLVPAKSSVETLVVDHIEKPSEN